MRQDILAATEALLVRTGDESAVSIRAIADAVGVTAPAIYLHFADKDELIREVCQVQFRKLDAAVESLLGDVDDPVERLRRRGQAYVRFGVGHPEHYRIMLMCKSPGTGEPGTGSLPGMASFEALVANVLACMDAGAFAEDDAFLVATVLWAGVHGLTSLRIAVPTFPAFADADALLDRLLDTMARGLAK